MQNVHFTPPQLAQIFEVNVSTIKRWVDKGILESRKTPGGHRRISKKQLDRFVKSYPKLTAKSYVIKRIKKNKKKLIDYKTYYKLLYEYDYLGSKKELLKHITKGTDIIVVVEDIIVPTLKRVGEDWALEKITILDEHRMSFVIRQHINMLGELINEPGKKSEMFLLACVPGENHEIGLQLVSLVLKMCGYRVCILGINVSAEQLIETAKSTKTRNIGLSKMYTRRGSIVGRLKKVINYCNKNNVNLYYGGRGWKNTEIKEINKSLKGRNYFNTLEKFRDQLKCKP